ncbi:MAG: hypothetical protein KDG50_12975 [Chromatiales bacterium]|nr:hypothetical protein [Chromatiales bacterium]
MMIALDPAVGRPGIVRNAPLPVETIHVGRARCLSSATKISEIAIDQALALARGVLSTWMQARKPSSPVAFPPDLVVAPWVRTPRVTLRGG